MFFNYSSMMILTSLLALFLQFVVVSGDLNSTRIISNMSDFEQFSRDLLNDDLNETVSLLCDLNFTGNDTILPLGVSENGVLMHCFQGIFHGNGHWIRGLHINTTNLPCVVSGFFGHIDGANISDLYFDDNCEFIGVHSGCVAGNLNNHYYTLLKNIHNFGRVEGEYSGGMIGYFDSVAYVQHMYFIDCHNHGTVIGRKITSASTVISAGGIVGCGTYGNPRDNSENSNDYYINSTNDGIITAYISGFSSNKIEARAGGFVVVMSFFILVIQ